MDILQRDPDRPLAPRSYEEVFDMYVKPDRKADLMNRVSGPHSRLVMVLHQGPAIRWFSGADAEGRALQLCQQQNMRCHLVSAGGLLLFQWIEPRRLQASPPQ